MKMVLAVATINQNKESLKDDTFQHKTAKAHEFRNYTKWQNYVDCSDIFVAKELTKPRYVVSSNTHKQKATEEKIGMANVCKITV